jgi:hypothetical protein
LVTEGGDPTGAIDEFGKKLKIAKIEKVSMG